MSEKNDDLRVPELEPRPITIDEYRAYAPEKFELIDGYLFDGSGYSDERRRLLKLLLLNVGLLEAVKLVPENRWRVAVERVYGSAGS